MHLAVLAIVASSTLLGGQFAAYSTKGLKQIDSREAPQTDEATAVVLSTHAPSGREEAVLLAPSVSGSLSGDIPDGAPETEIAAARAMISSRGGARSPDTTPATPPTPTPVPSPEPKKEPLMPHVYQVVKGDSLLRIAYKFGITPETVLWANDLKNAEMLQIGQQLTIPPVSGVLHQVKKGDTLAGIAALYGAEAGRVAEVNALVNPDQLPEGQLLVVPGGMRRTTEPIVGLPAPPGLQELAAAPKYTVKQGDTLLSIADAFGVRASVIQVANGLLDPDTLKIGQQLAIPGGKLSPKAPKPQSSPPAKSAPSLEPPKPAQPQGMPATQPAPEPPSRTGGDRIAALAQNYLGYAYLWGGHSPNTGFDCSGFTWYVYKEAGINIPMHDLAGQLNAGPRISRDNLLPGDLVFFENTYKPGLSHSGLYLGNGRFINAETEAVGVQIRSLSDPYWSPRYVGASRPW